MSTTTRTPFASIRGEEAEIVWTFGEAGEFEFACLIPGHYEAGMHGPLAIN